MIIMSYYAIYVVVSFALTMWVGQNLYTNGRTFLIDSFNNDIEKADSVNKLLLVGFYLINFGIVCFQLSIGTKPTNQVEVFEDLSIKFGIVLFVLGAAHFYNMRNIANMRAKALRKAEAAY